MNWNNVKITIFKEIRGIIRDKKSFEKLLIYPLLIPFIIMLFGFLFDVINETTYTVGINYNLTAEEKIILKEFDTLKTKHYDNKKELEEAYKNQEISGYIVKDEDEYTIYGDAAQNSGNMILSFASSYLESYNKILANKYLIENQINPEKVFNNIQIKTESLTKMESESDYLVNLTYELVITYVIMIITMVCVVVVTDATSGEKERGTLETILTFPIKSSELVIGKYLGTATLGAIVGIVSYGLSVPTLYIAKSMFKTFEDFTLTTSVTSIILAIFVILLAALLSAGVSMAFAGKTKTYKEAQSALQFVPMLPMIPYFLKVMEIDTFIFDLIPIANCGFALSDIVVNKINYQSLLVIVATSIIYIVAILIYISKQYKSEETLFS